METYALENDGLSLRIAGHGAELRSARDRADGHEYLWQADPAYWARTAPVLFPVVGNYRAKTTFYGGKPYVLGQHGFARDSEFSLVSATGTEAWFSLRESEETLRAYPFRFELLIGYALSGRTVTVTWRVRNTGADRMHFSIGAHPAFCAVPGEDSLLFDAAGPLRCGVLDADGLLSDEVRVIPLSSGKLPLADGLFDRDALILEGNQAHSVALVGADGKKRVQVDFDAPVAGIWSPAGKRAPFVCIEPWYGRTDRHDADQRLEGREWGNSLAPGGEFTRSYAITLSARG